MNRRELLCLVPALACRPARALYERPDEALASVQGAWKGTLTYRDYGKAERLVTLPTRLFVALGAPAQLVLHYVFDDGPGKTVFSYERMDFDFDNSQLRWQTGQGGAAVSVSRISSVARDAEATRIAFENGTAGKASRYGLLLSPRLLRLTKDELQADGAALFRNKFEFARTEG